MDLLGHITFNEIAAVTAVYLLGVVSGLALAWKLLGRWPHRD